tara:strand:- start:3078 stop:3422 length:345 start_codon:yes stop_codon:yes gene_type:complete
MAFKMKRNPMHSPMYKKAESPMYKEQNDEIPEGSTRETGRGDNKYSETYIDGNWVIDDGTDDAMNTAKKNEMMRRIKENEQMRKTLSPEEFEEWADATSKKRNYSSNIGNKILN